jgi:hypothetical protein
LSYPDSFGKTAGVTRKTRQTPILQRSGGAVKQTRRVLGCSNFVVTVAHCKCRRQHCHHSDAHPTEWQRIGNWIEATLVAARTYFLNVHCSVFQVFHGKAHLSI